MGVVGLVMSVICTTSCAGDAVRAYVLPDMVADCTPVVIARGRDSCSPAETVEAAFRDRPSISAIWMPFPK